MAAASSPGSTTPDGAITINGSGVAWDASKNIASGFGMNNTWANVTAIVKPIVDAAPSGLIDLTIVDNGNTNESMSLIVIFDDPNQTVQNTVILAFGAQLSSGDDFQISLAAPINKSNPGFSMDMSQAIAFSYQENGSQQFSIVNVNGARLTSSAGGSDDANGTPDDGNLATTGGIGDSNSNPVDPNAAPTNARSDDELYTLVPFVTDGDTSILVHTQNPSNDDNIYFAGFFMGATQAGVVGGPPSITNITPNSGPAAGGTSVVITGTNLTGGTVTFGGTSATCTVDSATQITCTSPAHAAGPVDVAVTTTKGTATSTGGFTYLPTIPAPTITGIVPNSGPTAGGTSVVITGTNLTDGTVTFGATAATCTVDSATQITCSSPAHAAGAVDVVVTTPGGPATSAGGFTYISAPTITGIVPNSGPVTGGTSVVITGTNLGTTFHVEFGATPTTCTVDSATQITCTSPAHAAGPVNVDISTLGGIASSVNGFTYIPAPTITGIVPSSGRAAGGTTVVITGTNLTGGTVTFGGTAATCTVDSATQITCTSPAHAAGAVDVVVTTPGGPVTSVGGFTYIPAPAITGIVPNSGPVTGGTTVVITGSNLTGGTVTFGGTSATCTVNSATQITCTSPAHAAGAVDVVVTTPGGPVTSAGGFTYNCIPTINILIAGAPNGSYCLSSGQSISRSYAVNNGPVKVQGVGGMLNIASARVAYTPDGGTTWTDFSEMLGLPANQATNTYWFPWYNNLQLDSQLRLANISSSPVTVTVTIAGVAQTPISLAVGQSLRVNYFVNDGPVKVQSVGGNIVATLRVAYKTGATWTNFSEVLGIPATQLNTTYWFPWYNNVDLNTQIRFANVSSSPVTVTVTIGGVAQTPIPLAAGQSTRVFYPIDNGPVKVQSSGGNIIASMREAYMTGTTWTSFSETMGLAPQQAQTTYWFPWYNNVGMNSQLRFANISSSPVTVTVTIGGVAQTPIPLAVGQSTRVSYPLNNGPVKVQSVGGNITASIRVAYNNGTAWTSFSEMMGLPNNQLTDTYWFPWYNNLELNTQMMFAVP